MNNAGCTLQYVPPVFLILILGGAEERMFFGGRTSESSSPPLDFGGGAERFPSRAEKRGFPAFFFDAGGTKSSDESSSSPCDCEAKADEATLMLKLASAI